VANPQESLVTKTDSEQIQELIQKSQTPLVLSHERPDGDAIGSLLAMGLALKRLGKQPQMAMVDGIPSRFHFLPGAEEVKKELPESYDLIIVLDCSDMDRIGFAPGRKPDINIDHHPTNEYFGVINYVEHSAAATTELLYRLFHNIDVPLDDEISDVLMLGLLTDTIGFRTSSVHPELFRIAADLLEKGARITELYDRALNQRSFVGAQYWGRGLGHLERQGEMLWTELSFEDRRVVGYPGNDDADLINLLSTIESPKIALIFVEQAENKVKVSWRSKVGYNVAQIATSFGGGGHEQAAGAMIAGALDEVKIKVLAATGRLLDSPEKENG
jgi:phosphoesterase RecJ-like protein